MKRTSITYAFICLISVSSNGQVKTDAPKETIQRVSNPKLIRSQGTDEYANVHCSLEDKEGNLWFGTTGEGLYKYDGKNFTNFLDKDGVDGNNVWCAYEDKSGRVWFGTDYGVCSYDPDSKSFKTYWIGHNFITTERDKNPVRSFLQDKNGTFWVGTDWGVFTSKEAPNDKMEFTNFLKGNNLIINKKNLELKVVSAILEDQAGKIWFASWNNEGACCYDGKSLTSFEPNGDNMVYSLLEDKEGNIWFGTRDHGVCRYDGIGPQKSYTNFADIPTFSTSTIYKMVLDKAGMIWFATEFGSGAPTDKQGGVWRYDPQTNGFTNFTVAGDGLTNNSVFTVLKTRSEDFWFGTRNTALCKFDPMGKKQKFIVYSE